MSPFHIYRQSCTARLVSDLPRRPGNALNIEVGRPSDRCMDKRPKTWAGVSSGRWLASGGDVFVFGHCCPVCPRLCSHGDGDKCWWCETDVEESL